MNEQWPPTANIELRVLNHPDLDGWLAIEGIIEPREPPENYYIGRMGGSFRAEDEQEGLEQVERMVRRQARAGGFVVDEVRML